MKVLVFIFVCTFRFATTTKIAIVIQDGLLQIAKRKEAALEEALTVGFTFWNMVSLSGNKCSKG